ncbi:unnamed protein product [Acanthoscelides obtectus]|uniref:Uncharacterized protein n=1 Tax=Acanthoscelides obtectus TaxID=200917 RepID=A0A9P0JM35_ACAOB|nr:unnamed protein product [Acanthoscelides obtectus]CAK1634643.1 hypothetical protein AOBTE_LOCUS8845 [Acanthoscelides obtectus]
MYNVVKFCKKAQFNLEKCGAILSTFYMTHNYVISRFDVSAEKIYNYFKDLVMCHSLPFPPSNLKILSHADATSVMSLFCKMYLRNLPLIRFLCSPNFAFQWQYELSVEELPEKPKDKKGNKKEKGGKKATDKGTKKGSKK